MKRFVLSALLVAVMVLALAVPAYAEHTMEHVAEETQRLKDLYLVPGYGNEAGQLEVYDPLTEQAQLLGLYGLAALCTNYGGYWYVAEDGYYYWHACTSTGPA